MWARALLILGVLAGIILGSQWAISRFEQRGYDAGYAAAQSKCDALMREVDARETANLALYQKQLAGMFRESERAYAQYQREIDNAQADTARTRAQLNSLLDTIRITADAVNAVPVPGAPEFSADSGRAAHTRALELLGDCSEAYAGMAEEADRLRRKVSGLQRWADSLTERSQP